MTTTTHPLADKAARQRFNRSLKAKGVPAKACSRCFTVKALGQFPSMGGGRLRAECKACHVARQAKRRQDPTVREQERQYKAKRRQDPTVREQERQYMAQYRAANQEKVRAKDRRRDAQRRADPEYQEWKRQCDARYRAANRDKVRQYDAQRRQTPERKAAQRLYNHRRRALLYSAETDGHTFDQLLDYWVDELGVTGCADCMRPLDEGFEIDHIVPLARGGADTMENKLPLCPDCHGSKLDRDPYAFYADRYPSLAPWLTPFAGLIPRLSDDEVQALVDAYEARGEAV